MSGRSSRNPRRGSALLAVLWLSIALSAIAFALSRSVRSELERAALNVDTTRAYFLAQGAIERATIHLAASGAGSPSDPAQASWQGPGWMRFEFPSGIADVEIRGESGKLNLNQASPAALQSLLLACGLEPSLAAATAARIVEGRLWPPWRGGGPQRGRNLTAASSFSGQQASFQELEELLMVPGVTPEILFGAYVPNERGELVRMGGLYHHVTLMGGGTVNATYASPEILRAAGLAEPQIESIVALREQRFLQSGDAGMADLRPRGSEIQLSTGATANLYTLRATARLWTGRAIRTVGALVQRAPSPGGAPFRVVRWYDMDF